MHCQSDSLIKPHCKKFRKDCRTERQKVSMREYVRQAFEDAV